MTAAGGIVTRLYSPVEVVGRLAAGRQQVYDVLAEPRTYPDWLVGAQRIRHVDPAFPAPHTTFDHSVGPTEETTIDDDTESIGSDPPRRLVLDVHIGPVRGTVDFRLVEDGDGTVLRFREKPTGPAAVLTPLLRPILYARNRASLRRLRTHVTSLRASSSQSHRT